MNGVARDNDVDTLRKVIVVNCSQTRYHVVRAAAVALGWYVEDENREDVPAYFYEVALRSDVRPYTKRLGPRGLAYDAGSSPQIQWLDKSVLPSRVAALSCHHRVNHFPAMHVVARKAVLFKRLMRIRRQLKVDSALAAAMRGFPWSFSASTELRQLERFLCDRQEQQQSPKSEPFFILKPNRGCQGKGIVLTPEPLQALETLTGKDGEDWLVQLYVTPPLCIERKKFDLRIYVLLTSVVAGRPPRLRRGMPQPFQPAASAGYAGLLDGLQLFVHQEGLVRICAEEYAAPSRTSCGQVRVHLTNYAVNKNAEGFSVGFTRETSHGAVCEGNKRDFKFLQHYINGLPDKERDVDSPAEAPAVTRWECLLRRIDLCIMLTILSGLEELRREFIGTGASRGSRSDGRNCFELLGFDFMLTEGLEPVLMEVNHSPSLFCDSAFDFETKRRVVMDVFRQLEPHVPSLEACDDAAYAAYQAIPHAAASDATVGFRQISPQRTSAATAGSDDGFWCEEEMRMFEEMLRLTRVR
ncbi:putative tubulin-tyrosine ligase [Trypanosoma rangeli]|uniref:Putative tubulin-tyrosine ligase n=1 Tax=Trypanosoma rangeli TaxID=5698 RepID=A0A422N064_TRYRA|nr:putative tubulin-tyrosine ligase [Trypanosoma rangeli]RNE98847.1 putative tubulin-tyrosine ligase [Trypanosoma rangeli]|eukprot:RNE98847.1 putative tubulin-tyrosine ligase [Trypanosoma rangeli]